MVNVTASAVRLVFHPSERKPVRKCETRFMVWRRPTVSPCCELAGYVMDVRQGYTLKVLVQKRRGMRELVSSRICLASERVDALEVEIAALGEVEEHGVDERPNLLIPSTRKSCKAPRSWAVKGWRPEANS